MSGVESIVSFQDPLGPPDLDHPRPDRLVAGNPERRTWNLYEAQQETVFSGIWECDVGAWRVAYPAGQDELCTLIYGRVRLTDAWGGERSFGPGDSFLIPGGFEGTWETLETLRKVYMIVQRPTSDAPAPAEARD
jgi:uncharacterized cupin superfamily protein